MEILTKKVLQDKPLSQLVEVPKLGYSVRIKKLSAQEQGEFTSMAIGAEPEQLRNIMASQKYRLVSMCLVHEDGSRMFSIGEAGELDAKDVHILFEACVEVNKVEQSDADKVDEAAKKSEPTVDSDSPTDSPVT